MAGALGLATLELPARAAEDKPAFKDDKEKASYAIGMYFGNQIKRSNLEVDMDAVNAAIRDVLAGEPKLPEQEAQGAIQTYQKTAMAKAAEKNRQEGDAFLAENAKKDGIRTKTITLPDGKQAELQYRVLAEGTGDIPKSTDTVSVNYRGTLIDGKEFDNSAKHPNPPAKFPVGGVVRGWTEALQMMKVGAKWQLYLPAALAYGETGRPGIPPGSTLIFEMELLGIDQPKPAAAAAPPAPAPQPLTSDIIRVPSAEELKKGAKIEVIKAEDAAKMAASEAAKQKQADPPKDPNKP